MFLWLKKVLSNIKLIPPPPLQVESGYYRVNLDLIFKIGGRCIYTLQDYLYIKEFIAPNEIDLECDYVYIFS